MTTECLNKVSTLRLFLKEHFYSREDIIGQILDQINISFDVFTLNYDHMNQTIKMKIKITNMKKRFCDYEHNSFYYYNTMNHILMNVFNSNIGLLDNLIKHHNPDINILDNNISGLYNITTLLDNIIIINL